MIRELGTSMPVYTTRKSGDGYTMTYSVPAWNAFGAMLLILANIWVWGVVGLITAVKVVF